ncbi:MAG: GyrI-like domain-containing protein [Planctomycetales bacterium]
MSVLDSRQRLQELYLPSAEDFALVDVPELRFLMVDGEGNPKGERFQQMIRWLFAVVHPLRVIGRKRMGKDFVEPPLECLWWADDLRDFIDGRQDKLKWRLMIVADADWINEEMVGQAIRKASRKLGEAPAGLRLERYAEGTSLQIMHVGPPGSQAATMTRLHHELLPARHLVPNGHHHEIYLNDHRRVAPAKLKTVLRLPVRPCPKRMTKRRSAGSKPLASNHRVRPAGRDDA